MAIEGIQKAEEKGVQKREEFSQKLEEKSASLGQMRRQLAVVKNELEKLREKERLLGNGLEDGAQEIGQLKARDKEIRQQQESMSARRLKTQRLLNEFLNSKPTTEENSKQSTVEDYQTLLWAARNGHEAIVRMLVDRGADVAVKDQEVVTPLHCAAENGDEAIVQMLIDRGVQKPVDRGAQKPVYRGDVTNLTSILSKRSKFCHEMTGF